MQVVPVIVLFLVSTLVVKGWLSNDFQSKALAISGSPTTYESGKQFISYATVRYDYNLAREIYQAMDKNKLVLGANTDLDSLLYPEKTLRDFRDSLIQKAQTQFSRQLYLQLAVTSWQLFDQNEAQKYLKLAQSLDPNDPSIYPISQLLKLN